jgi:HAE1 family hydrophobic/amphiphilic exporter-1
LTLFTTPVVYLYLDRLSEAFSRWGRSSGDGDRESEDARAARQAAE